MVASMGHQSYTDTDRSSILLLTTKGPLGCFHILCLFGHIQYRKILCILRISMTYLLMHIPDS